MKDNAMEAGATNVERPKPISKEEIEALVERLETAKEQYLKVVNEVVSPAWLERLDQTTFDAGAITEIIDENYFLNQSKKKEEVVEELFESIERGTRH